MVVKVPFSNGPPSMDLFIVGLETFVPFQFRHWKKRSALAEPVIHELSYNGLMDDWAVYTDFGATIPSEQ